MIGVIWRESVARLGLFCPIDSLGLSVPQGIPSQRCDAECFEGVGEICEVIWRIGK